jgi:hypothetical protein
LASPKRPSSISTRTSRPPHVLAIRPAAKDLFKRCGGRFPLTKIGQQEPEVGQGLRVAGLQAGVLLKAGDGQGVFLVLFGPMRLLEQETGVMAKLQDVQPVDGRTCDREGQDQGGQKTEVYEGFHR